MKNALIYVLSFVLAAAVGFAGVFFVKQSGTPQKPLPVQQHSTPVKTQPAVTQPQQDTAQQNVAEEEPVEMTVTHSGYDRPVLVIDNRIVENASGSSFKVSGFSVTGKTSDRIEYVISSKNSSFSSSSEGSPESSGSVVIPSGAAYSIVAIDKQSGLESEEMSFSLAKKLTKEALEGVVNDTRNFDTSQKSISGLCASNYKISCQGYEAKSIPAVNELLDMLPELSGKTARVSNMKYNKDGKFHSCTVKFE